MARTRSTEMARSKKRNGSKNLRQNLARNWKSVLFFALNLFVVLSMALGYVLMIVARR